MGRLIDQNAPAETLTAWKRHLRVCDRCAASVAGLRAGLEPQAELRTPLAPLADTTGVAPPVVGLEPNLLIGDFRIERRLGSGGMGVVYQAVQLSLNRRVALKVLPFGPTTGTSAVERFRREARAAAQLCHPGIVTVFAEGAERNVCYFAMEMINGRNLDAVIAGLKRRSSLVARYSDPRPEQLDRPPEKEAASPCLLIDCKTEGQYFHAVARLIGGAAEALHYAHGHGIIHRDVKPSNLMLSSDGRLILLDFGIARVCEEHAMTVTASFVGTPRYMSPEQIVGGDAKPDHRCDIYSLGATLYELLTLEPLVDGDTQHQVIHQILSETVRRPRQVNHRIPLDLDTICYKAIEKDPTRRYQSAAELAEDLRRYVSGRVIRARRPGLVNRLAKLVRRHKAITALVCLVVAASTAAGLIGWKHYSTRWAQQYAMAEIDNLLGQKDYFAALRLAERAERYIPNDPLLVDRWPRLSREHTVITTPPGSRIYIREYFRTDGGWKYLGRTPLRHIRIPFGTYRWKVMKGGFVPLETVQTNDPPSSNAGPTGQLARQMDFTLQDAATSPPDMVWIPPSNLDQMGLYHGQRLILLAPAYFIDKYEVTNGQFKEFVDAGGYEKPDFWKDEFARDGKVLPWTEAVQQFRDQTGRFGPSSWREGSCPEGQEDDPVGGVSWYEAMAYARFRGKDLPTVFHWVLAARADDNPCTIVGMSNFGDGPAPVGTYAGMGKFGLCDAAGNVREWCGNAVEGIDDARCILGGAWDEHAYSFSAGGGARSPWDRDPCNGLRCVLYVGGKETVPPMAMAPVERKNRDFSYFKPVSDDVFASYLDTSYRYDPAELNARIERTDYDLGYCRRERVSFDAAYPGERVIAYLYLPEEAKPPCQAVVWFPGDEARDSPWTEQAHTHEMTAIIRSGRALVVPIYKGTYERRLSRIYPPEGVQSRNLCIQRSQDLRRTIDYLKTRDDIEIAKLAYVGLSWGGQMGPVMIATEPRFKTGILLLGGICACKRHPASDPANFAPRVMIPILMINNATDSVFPLETAQKPLFDLLGTPVEQKKHILFPGEHSIAWGARGQYHKAITDWLDCHLGPVEKTAQEPSGENRNAANQP
jgi:eukaryotic-like serine/threonine-protein kinase